MKNPSFFYSLLLSSKTCSINVNFSARNDNSKINSLFYARVIDSAAKEEEMIVLTRTL